MVHNRPADPNYSELTPLLRQAQSQQAPAPTQKGSLSSPNGTHQADQPVPEVLQQTAEATDTKGRETLDNSPHEAETPLDTNRFYGDEYNSTEYDQYTPYEYTPPPQENKLPRMRPPGLKPPPEPLPQPPSGVAPYKAPARSNRALPTPTPKTTKPLDIQSYTPQEEVEIPEEPPQQASPSRNPSLPPRAATPPYASSNQYITLPKRTEEPPPDQYAWPPTTPQPAAPPPDARPSPITTPQNREGGHYIPLSEMGISPQQTETTAPSHAPKPPVSPEPTPALSSSPQPASPKTKTTIANFKNGAIYQDALKQAGSLRLRAAHKISRLFRSTFGLEGSTRKEKAQNILDAVDSYEQTIEVLKSYSQAIKNSIGPFPKKAIDHYEQLLEGMVKNISKDALEIDKSLADAAMDQLRQVIENFPEDKIDSLQTSTLMDFQRLTPRFSSKLESRMQAAFDKEFKELHAHSGKSKADKEIQKQSVEKIIGMLEPLKSMPLTEENKSLIALMLKNACDAYQAIPTAELLQNLDAAFNHLDSPFSFIIGRELTSPKNIGLPTYFYPALLSAHTATPAIQNGMVTAAAQIPRAFGSAALGLTGAQDELTKRIADMKANLNTGIITQQVFDRDVEPLQRKLTEMSAALRPALESIESSLYSEVTRKGDPLQCVVSDSLISSANRTDVGTRSQPKVQSDAFHQVAVTSTHQLKFSSKNPSIDKDPIADDSLFWSASTPGATVLFSSVADGSGGGQDAVNAAVLANKTFSGQVQSQVGTNPPKPGELSQVLMNATVKTHQHFEESDSENIGQTTHTGLIAVSQKNGEIYGAVSLMGDCCAYIVYETAEGKTEVSVLRPLYGKDVSDSGGGFNTGVRPDDYREFQAFDFTIPPGAKNPMVIQGSDGISDNLDPEFVLSDEGQALVAANNTPENFYKSEIPIKFEGKTSDLKSFYNNKTGAKFKTPDELKNHLADHPEISAEEKSKLAAFGAVSDWKSPEAQVLKEIYEKCTLRQLVKDNKGANLAEALTRHAAAQGKPDDIIAQVTLLAPPS